MRSWWERALCTHLPSRFLPPLVLFVLLLQAAGCDAILVGESIVREGDPETAVKQLLA